ncbi:MAG: glycoside hydrolase family 64 protein [Micromonosporaceae bacterium]
MVTRRTFLTASGVALSAPFWGNPASLGATAPETCELALENRGGPARAYVTGREEGTGRWLLLRADGSYYHLEEPGAPQTPLPVDCSIPLNAAGAPPVVLTLRHMYGARVYFVREDTLDFFVNPGPSLVEPAFATEADPNYRKIWSFCEFTFNTTQIFVNISYVDLVTALSIGLNLEGDSTQTVEPMPSGAVDAIAGGLADQAASDGQAWDQLVLRDGGTVLRAISPQVLMAPYFDNPAEMPFRDHWNSYIDQVWEKYRGTDLRVDLQGGRGVRTGRVTGDNLVFDGGHSFSKPVSRDIFTCNHGPFANNPSDPDDKKGILARLAAAFNRSTLLTHADQPNGPRTGDYYQDPSTNHWSRIVHANTPIGYAFPYDDVRPDGEPDVSGAVHDGNPRRLTITTG